ncbi:MAG: hypothetical protein SGARI_004565, partial [Bacillariaceae sp.]
MVLHNWLIDMNDTTDDLAEDEDDDVPHPNDIFDPQLGQEEVMDENLDRRQLLLNSLIEFGL